MDMIQTKTLEYPLLHVGDYVRVAEWYGVVVDIAISERGRVMVLIKSPKMTWRNGGVEWLEWLRAQPNLIQPATREDYNLEVNRYLARLDNTEQKLIELLT